MIKQVILVLLLSISSISVFAQKGSAKGNVKDGKTGEALIGASVYVDGTTIGTVTDFDGNYALPNIPAGVVTLKCSFISYETLSKENISVNEGNPVSVDFVLGSSTVELNDVKVFAKAKRESEVVLLLDQKKSAVIKQSIGAQELANQGVSDAAAAAAKITGISKQEGTNGLNVRGLGDRYNSTTLNGLPLPSNDSQFKNIDLKLFSTDIIEFVDVQKVSMSNLSGDFAGANINIVSKKHSGENFFKVGVKTGLNSSTLDADKFYMSDGPNLTGFYNSDYPTDFSNYKFENKWNPQEKTIYPNLGLALSGGKTFNFENSKLNIFGTLSFDNEYYYGELAERKINGSNDLRKDLTGEEYQYDTQTTGMINLNYNWNNSNIYLNSMFLNTSEDWIGSGTGYIKDLAEEGALVRKMEYEKNTVLVNQLLGDHKLNSKTDIHWGVTYNNVNNVVPDRRYITMENGTDTEKEFATNDPANNSRYYHDLVEDEIAGNFNLDYKFGEGFEDAGYKGKLSVGYSGKFKTRSFEAVQFNHKILNNRLTNVDDIDSYFNNEGLQNKLFDLRVRSSHFIVFDTYDGKQTINAGFASLEYNFTARLLLLLGVRLENVYQQIEYNTALGSDKNDFTELNVLPDLSLRYALTDKSNLRFAAGVTYTLPQFKETALFSFQDKDEESLGNPYLTPSKNYNGELKWEVYPKPNELFSAAVFGKYIVDPINKFVMASASNDFTYANTGDWAYVYGVELEAKKDILTISSGNSAKKLYTTANLTLMKTEQTLDSEKINEQSQGLVNANFNKDKEELQGAAPLIANANLSYKYSWNTVNSITSTISYNYVSDRLNLIGYASLGNQVDKEIHNLDFVVKSKLKKFGVSLSVKNILNQNIDRIQENETQNWLVKHHKKGVKFSLGVNYTF
ncbi:TonB-dependent receptor [Labilibaculum euxinus]